MKKINNLLFILFSLISIVSCSDVTRNVEKLMGKTVQMNLDSMLCWTGDSLNVSCDNNCIKESKYIVYIDSSLCSSCNIKKLYLWNNLMDKMQNIQFVFIVAPHKKEDIDYLPVFLKQTRLKCPVYIDGHYCFLRDNSFFPKAPLYHTVLLDSNNKIILVGSPLQNRKIESMAISITKDILTIKK